MPRPEFGTAPFCGGSAASSAVISGAAKAELGIAATAPKTAAQVNVKKCLNMILHSLQLFHGRYWTLPISVNVVRRRR
jgi:hypothetical protein